MGPIAGGLRRRPVFTARVRRLDLAAPVRRLPAHRRTPRHRDWMQA